MLSTNPYFTMKPVLRPFVSRVKSTLYHAATKGILRLKAPSPLPVYENNAYGRKKKEANADIARDYRIIFFGSKPDKIEQNRQIFMK